MPHTMLENAGEHIADSVREATRLTAAITDAIEDGIGVAGRAIRQGGDATEDFVHDSKRRIQRNPLTATAVALAAGFIAGMLTSLVIRRRQL